MLLERDDDLRQLAAALERVAASGRGEVALVAAEAGGGKTSLVRQLAAEAPADHGAAVWWGSCLAAISFGKPSRSDERTRRASRVRGHRQGKYRSDQRGLRGFRELLQSVRK